MFLCEDRSSIVGKRLKASRGQLLTIPGIGLCGTLPLSPRSFLVDGDLLKRTREQESKNAFPSLPLEKTARGESDDR